MGFKESLPAKLACLKSLNLFSIANTCHYKGFIKQYSDTIKHKKDSGIHAIDVAGENTETVPTDTTATEEQTSKHTNNSVLLVTGELLYEPQEPGPEDCCGRGCQECVWTQYWDSKVEYNNVVAEMNGIERERTAFEIFEERLARQKKS